MLRPAARRPAWCGAGDSRAPGLGLSGGPRGPGALGFCTQPSRMLPPTPRAPRPSQGELLMDSTPWPATLGRRHGSDALAQEAQFLPVEEEKVLAVETHSGGLGFSSVL
ncbi:Hypothetical predicted protein [Marmota monax]|uniref:Uncharacterized protein n=1 Tax=Marmota monax TaxID=9995 RepID=A0A5E4AWG6_MARMO|nr:Hypothetical predicted protein [Marmota monax]